MDLLRPLFGLLTPGIVILIFLWLFSRVIWLRRESSIVETGQVYISRPEVLGRQLFGRAQELTTILWQMDLGKTVVVSGGPGIGKTSLGKAAAMSLVQQHERLVWVRCTSNTDVRSFMDRFSLHAKMVYDELALREAYEKGEAHDTAQWIDLLTDYLSRHSYVFFVDDLYLVENQDVLCDLLPRLCTAASTLIMTRELGLEVKTTIRQARLLAEIQLPGLADTDAVELLQQMGLRQESEEGLLKLARRLGGHPKALEICAGLVCDVESKVTLTQLATDPLLGKHRENILEQTVRLSDDRLSRNERLMMVACAAFFEPFTREALLAVFSIFCRKSGAEILARLRSRCLVDSGGQETLSLHPLVQEYYEGVGRRTYGARLLRARVVSVTFSERLHRWLISFSPLNLTNNCLLAGIRFHIAKYLQALGTESLQARQRVVRYLVEALALDEIVEIEKSQYRVRKHPFTLVLQFPTALFLVACFVGLLNLMLMNIHSTGWHWVAWLVQHQIPASVSFAAACVAAWVWLEIRSLRKSYMVVTADRSLCMKNLGGEYMFVETGLSWFAVPTPFFFTGHFGRYETPEEYVLLDPRHIRFRNREFGRFLLQRRLHRTRGIPLHQSFGFIDRPETQYQALMQALKPAIQMTEQVQPIPLAGAQGNEVVAMTPTDLIDQQNGSGEHAISLSGVEDQQVAEARTTEPRGARPSGRGTTFQKPYTDLQRSLATGNVCAFVGAGLSAGAGLPGWYDLIAELSARIGYELPPAKWATGDALIDAAQVYVNRQGLHSLISHLKDRLDTTGKEPTAAHRALARLPISLVFTANFDDLLECAFKGVGKRVEVVVRDSSIPFMRRGPDTVNIVKLYGDLDQPETIVLARQQYESYFLQRPQMVKLLETELARSDTLYMGWSGSDPYFKLVFGELLSRFGGMIRPGYAVMFDVTKDQRDELARKQIRLVELPAGDRTGQLAGWLESLASPGATLATGAPAATASEIAAAKPAPEAAEASGMLPSRSAPQWNTAALRDLLTAAFSDGELTTFCFDNFRPVYEDFASGMSKGDKIQRLLDYCDRHVQVEELLAGVQKANPVQYQRREEQLRG